MDRVPDMRMLGETRRSQASSGRRVLNVTMRIIPRFDDAVYRPKILGQGRLMYFRGCLNSSIRFKGPPGYPRRVATLSTSGTSPTTRSTARPL